VVQQLQRAGRIERVVAVVGHHLTVAQGFLCAKAAGVRSDREHRYRRRMTADEPLIIQVAQGGAVDRQLRSDPPPSVANGAAVLTAGPADDRGHLEPPGAGQVVLSVPSPEALASDPEEVRRVIARAGTGVEPLVVVVEAAEGLREDELAPVLEAARHTDRGVILRVARDA
jgi:hypothetical protein